MPGINSGTSDLSFYIYCMISRTNVFRKTNKTNLSVPVLLEGSVKCILSLTLRMCVCVCRLQVFLNTYGIQTQTPQQVEPIQIWPQQELVKVFA